MAHANVSSSSCGQHVELGRDAVYSFFQLSSNRHSPPHPAAHRRTSTSLRCRFHQREPCFWGSCANARCIRSSQSPSDDLKLDTLLVRIREKNHNVTSPSRHQISDERRKDRTNECSVHTLVSIRSRSDDHDLKLDALLVRRSIWSPIWIGCGARGILIGKCQSDSVGVGVDKNKLEVSFSLSLKICQLIF